MKKIKVEVLTKEAFAPFGEVLTPEGRKDCGVPGSHTWFPDVVVREESVMCTVIFKKNTSQEDIYFTELSEPVGFELS